MMKKIIFIFLFITLVFYSHCFAEDIYFASVQTGNGSGDSCSNAKAYTTITWGEGVGRIGPGDTLHICGRITLDAGGGPVINVGVNGTEQDPITIKFEKDAVLQAPYFGGATNKGAINITNHDWIIIDGGTNGIIRNTDNGGNLTYQRKSYGIVLSNAHNCIIKNLTISKLYDAKDDGTEDTRISIEGGSDNYIRAIYASNCNNLRIYNNNINSAGWAITVSGSAHYGLYIYNNTITDISAAIVLASGGLFSNINIYSNKISDNSQWSYNDGIKFFAESEVYTHEFSGVKIYNNYMEKLCSGGVYGATSFILMDQARHTSPEIYNNVLVGTASDNCANGYITIGNHTNEQVGRDIDAKVYNNTIIKTFAGLDIIFLITKKGRNVKLLNNIVKAVGNTYVTALNDAYCSGISDFNNYWTTSGTLAFGITEGANSIIADPLLTSDYKLQYNSPGVNTGSSEVNSVLNTDKEGNPRPNGSGWDIGAYEYVESNEPRPPQNLRILSP